MIDYRNEIAPKMLGLWPEFFANIGIDVGVMRGQNSKNGPCPLCGGDDRAHWRDVDGRLALFCRACANDRMKSPEDVAMEVTGWTFSQLVGEVSTFLLYPSDESSGWSFEKQREKQRAKELAELKEKERAAESCYHIMSASHPADSLHPYLSRKGVKPYGAYSYKGMILIPVINKSGSLINIQFISEDGSKRFKKGCQTIGGMSWISPFISKDCDIVVCEGYATGATLAEALSLPVCVSFSSHNLPIVVASIRESMGNRIIIACDNDDILIPAPTPDDPFRKVKSNPGMKAAKLASSTDNTIIMAPEFRECMATDWNDLGVDSVRAKYLDVAF